MELLSWSSFKTSSDAGPSVSCHRYQPERRTLIAGLADGHLAYWTRRKDGGSQGSSDAKPFLLHAHAGGVRCVLLVESEGLGLEGCLLFTGGADRTIRVWDPTLRDAKKACVQTLRAHGGTVAALAYCEGQSKDDSKEMFTKELAYLEERRLALHLRKVTKGARADQFRKGIEAKKRASSLSSIVEAARTTAHEGGGGRGPGLGPLEA